MTISTCEAEYVAVSSYICHAIWLKRLLQDIYFSQGDATKIYVDSKSAMALAKNRSIMKGVSISTFIFIS